MSRPLSRIPDFPFAFLCVLGPALQAQQTPPPPTPIAYVATEGVTISGSLEVANGRAVIGNNGAITAGDKTANISLARGGTLRLCSTTTVHLSRDRSITDQQSTALMIALDRGALEASYTTGKYSDVLMTPDLRILISGPGPADLKIRVSPKGDTCLDNHGANAPYVTVTSLLEGGLYRVQPNQRVLFEHGSLSEVVDNEPESCGCPPAAPVVVANAAIGSSTPAPPGKPAPAQPVGGPSSTPTDTAFPLAQSEGLAPAPPPPTTPAVPAGETHAQVTVPLVYNSDAPPPPPDAVPKPNPAPEAAAAATPSQPLAKKSGGFFQSIGRFFSRIFGGKG
ncbi:MAG TPA: nuclease [Silvibacterium sp.]|nr:nuclease [Silvibacterium sp.]